MQLPATLTIAEAPQALASALATLSAHGAGAGFVVDAAPLAEFDTSAIAVLLELQRQSRARGLAFEVNRAPAKLHQLAALYGVEDLLGLQAAQ
jgi:phospholipid transport system transporter-binding protein